MTAGTLFLYTVYGFETIEIKLTRTQITVKRNSQTAVISCDVNNY